VLKAIRRGDRGGWAAVGVYLASAHVPKWCFREARRARLRIAPELGRLISGEIPYETWASEFPFRPRIVETIALDALEAAGAEESARVAEISAGSGLIRKTNF